MGLNNPMAPGLFPLRGNGPPVSGPGGTIPQALGQTYLDMLPGGNPVTANNPAVVYQNIASLLTSPLWMALLSGNVV